MHAKNTNAPAQNFASDNNAGACPEVMDALMRANATGHVSAYGNDPWTQLVCDRMRELFETDCDVYFVFNGTAANSLSLASLCQPYHSVVCAETAHIETDECGAPEFFSNGSKLLLGSGKNGKLTPDAIEELVTKRTDIHYPKPKIVSLTQSTELGTVYRPDELRDLASVAKRHDMKMHMDGARFANAVASLGDVSPADLTWRAGVDVLCFGGSKNGLPVGEAVIFFDRQHGEDFAYRAKQAGQLCSKMRFISAPWLGLLDHDLWLKNARHANAMAQDLAGRLSAIAAIEVLYPCEANAVFARIPPPVVQRMRERGWHFYDFIGGSSRIMCAWDTEAETVERFASDLERAVEGECG